MSDKKPNLEEIARFGACQVQRNRLESGDKRINVEASGNATQEELDLVNRLNQDIHSHGLTEEEMLSKINKGLLGHIKEKKEQEKYNTQFRTDKKGKVRDYFTVSHFMKEFEEKSRELPRIDYQDAVKIVNNSLNNWIKAPEVDVKAVIGEYLLDELNIPEHDHENQKLYSKEFAKFANEELFPYNYELRGREHQTRKGIPKKVLFAEIAKHYGIKLDDVKVKKKKEVEPIKEGQLELFD